MSSYGSPGFESGVARDGVHEHGLYLHALNFLVMKVEGSAAVKLGTNVKPGAGTGVRWLAIGEGSLW